MVRELRSTCHDLCSINDAARFAAATKGTRAAIEASEKAGDEVSADLLNETTGILDKDLWFLEAHLQA